MSKAEIVAEFKLFLESMTNDISKLRKEVHKLKASSHFRLYKELQELKQGSMSVKEYFDELHIARLRAKVKESSRATMDRFLHGLNPDIAKQMHLYPYSDLQGMVFIAIGIEKLMKKKERDREKDRIKKEKEAHEKMLEEKRKLESERENEFEVPKIIESDLSEHKKNESESKEKGYEKEETFVDTNDPFPSVVLSPLQGQNYDNSKTIVPHGENEPQESRTTLFQEEENDRGASGVLCGVQQSPEKSEVFERLEKTFRLDFASLMAHNVNIYVESANEALTMPIQAHIHDFTTHRSLSTWKNMKIHEIGVT